MAGVASRARSRVRNTGNAAADYADIVLPATTFFEHKELQTAYGHLHLQISNQAIAPLGARTALLDALATLIVDRNA